MQSEHINPYHYTPKPGEVIEYVEKAKPGTKPEHEDELLSQPSTVHSLSQLDFTPEKTPMSTNLQKEWSNLSGDFKQKASHFKGKLVEKFGEQPHPEKDLDSEVKEHIKEVNEEIRDMPHGEEEVFEGQGQVKPSLKERGSEKLGEMKGKLGEQVQGLKENAARKVEQTKGKLTEKFGEQPQPEKDLDKETKEHVKEINEEIRQLPHGEEEVFEGQGQDRQEKKDFSSEKREEFRRPSGEEQQDFKKMSQGIVDKALGKIDEMKGKASEQGEKLKEGVKETTSSQKTSHVEPQEGKEPLTKSSKEEILDLAQQITDKVQELKTAGQLSAGQEKPQGSPQQREGPSQGSPKESHEHHQLSADSQSFKPTKESHVLMEKVKEGLEEHIPLKEVIDEIEHEKQPQSQERQPIIEKLQEGIQNVKEKFNAPKQEEKTEFRQERREEPRLPPGLENFQGQEPELQQEQPRFEQRQEAPREEFRQERPRPEFEQREEKFQPQEGQSEQRQPIIEKLQEGIQNVREKFNAPKQEEKSEFRQERREEPRLPPGLEDFQGQKPELQQEQPRFEQRQEAPREEFRQERPDEGFQGERPEFQQREEKFQPQESQFEQRQPVIDKIQEGIQNVKEKFSGPKQEEKSEEKPEEPQGELKYTQNFDKSPRKVLVGEKTKEEERQEAPREELSKQEEKPKENLEVKPENEGDFEGKKSSKDSIKETVQEASNKISEKVQDVKDSITKERQPIIDQILGRIHSVNDNLHQSVQSVKDAFKVEERTDDRKPLVDIVSGKISDVNTSIHNVSTSISQSVESLKNKVRPTRKEKQPEIPQKEESPEPSEESHEFSEESGPTLRQKLSGGYRDFTNKLSQNVENVKGRIIPKKEKGEEFHKVDENEGFHGETVKDYKDEKRLGELGGHELISENPYQSLYEDKAELEKQTYLGKLKSMFRKEKGEDEEDEDEKIKDLDEIAPEPVKEEGQSLKEKLSHGMESLKGRFRPAPKDNTEEKGEEKLEKKRSSEEEGVLRRDVSQDIDSLKETKSLEKGKELLEEKVEPLKEEGEELIGEWKSGLKKKEELLEGKSEELPEKESLKQRISGGLQSISGKISQNVDSLKGRFRSGKEEGTQEEEIEYLDEPEEQEENEPTEPEKPTLRQKLTEGFQGLKSRFTPGKGKNEGEPKEGEFHVVTEGTTETISELKEEERVEPLLSNNPFEPLETKDTNLVQPLEGNDVVGGELKELTADEKPAFKVEETEENEEVAESKSLFQKVKTGLLSTFSKNKDKENVE